jgi:hypothetical protein
MSKVVYLTEQPLDDWNYDRFGIQAWIDRGWAVEVWDMTPYLYPRAWQLHFDAGGKLNAFDGCHAIASEIQLQRQFSAAGKIDCFIDLAGDSYAALRIKRRLAKSGATRVICAVGAIPVIGGQGNSSVIRKLRKAFASGPARSLKLLANAIVYRLFAPSISPGVIVVSGQDSIPAICSRHTPRVVRAHNLDYDIYMALRNSVAHLSGEYAVFIDQNYCFHPEFIYQDLPATLSPEKYFSAICRGLRKMSHALGVEVKIAAHPRTGYHSRSRDNFEGIPTLYGRTAELIANCKVAVCHDSTAIQLAVLFGKPVIFVTTDELNAVFFDSSFKRDSITCFAAALGKSVINLDGDLDGVDWKAELSVDHGKYADYRNRYIKTDGSPEQPLWEIVIGHFEQAANGGSSPAQKRIESPEILNR